MEKGLLLRLKKEMTHHPTRNLNQFSFPPVTDALTETEIETLLKKNY